MKENMIMTNTMPGIERSLPPRDQLIPIPDVNEREQIVPSGGCQCQTVVHRMHCRTKFLTREICRYFPLWKKWTMKHFGKVFYANEAEQFSAKLDRFK